MSDSQKRILIGGALALLSLIAAACDYTPVTEVTQQKVAAAESTPSMATPYPTDARTTTRVATPVMTPTVITYTVQSGDRLIKIAERFGTTVDAIAEANAIEDKNLIRAGQVLIIPLTPALAVTLTTEPSPTPTSVLTPTSVPSAWISGIDCNEGSDSFGQVAAAIVRLWEQPGPTRGDVVGKVWHGSPVTVSREQYVTEEGRNYYLISSADARGWVAESSVWHTKPGQLGCPESEIIRLLTEGGVLSTPGAAAIEEAPEEKRPATVTWNWTMVGVMGILGSVVGCTVGAALGYAVADKRQSRLQKHRWIDLALRWDGKTSLRHADLVNADLRAVELAGADLSYANLQGADLTSANLQAANLSYANLDDSTLAGADLKDTKLVGASLRGANLDGAELQDAVLDGAMEDRHTRWPQGFEKPETVVRISGRWRFLG